MQFPAVCLRLSELLSSLRLEFLADVDDGNADSSACFTGLGGASAGCARRRRRRRCGDAVPATTWFPSLPKLQQRRSKKKQAYRLMF
jgi:hypothetical protein